MFCAEPIITASTEDITLLLDETEPLEVSIKGLEANELISLQFFAQHEELIKIEPRVLSLNKNDEVYKVEFTGLHPGCVLN